MIDFIVLGALVLLARGVIAAAWSTVRAGLLQAR
jgi:hypothetical protein